jgi:hypothetical protein
LRGALASLAPAARPLELALQLAARALLGLELPRRSVDALLASQGSDGLFPAGPLYSLGRHALYFGSRALTTVFALRALERYP